MKRTLVPMGILAASLWSLPAFAAPKIVFKETTIQGEVQKPEVTQFMSRQNLNKAYDLVLKESFLQKITDAVEHAPF